MKLRKPTTASSRSGRAGAIVNRTGAYCLRAVLHSLLAVPPAWLAFERALVVARHHAGGSKLLAALAAEWLYAMRRWRPTDLTRVATLPGGSRLAIVLSDGWHRGIYFRGEYEPETTAFLRRFLRPGDTFIDLGANIGYFSCLAAAHGANVHAFEPNPSMVERLERTRDLNGFAERMRINPIAVASRDGSAEFHVSPQQANTGLSSLLPLPHLQGGAVLKVPTVTLDTYCDRQRLAPIRLLKIDVEGAELQVLAGAGRVLSEWRPDAIICEMGGFAAGSRPSYVMRRFLAAGYVPHEITLDALTPLTCDPDSLDRPDWPQRNICFLRREGVAEPTPAPALAASVPTPVPVSAPLTSADAWAEAESEARQRVG